MTDSSVAGPDGAANVIDTGYEVGQDNIQAQIGPFGLDIHNPVFMISGLSIVAFVFLTLAFQDSVGPLFNDMRSWLTSTLDWFFISAANVFVLLCLFLVLSPLGRVRLGGQDAKPDYGYPGWFAMLFAAGMGIGLMFYGVSEPISHFTSSMGGASLGDGRGALQAMAVSTGFPFTIVLLLACYSIVKGLMSEPRD